ncbi:glycosyltransferase family protein [Ichthyenterobacterium magnum]|uniref:Glycosyltransferase involved in cell wall biosynthesis n=1 Tax=Ichthyenterobacterium magnum TaxID=1230530 RepID=A0A420DH05_9FLAO|nr:UDP-glycosyltransferase [Ichthyenterobacterium magnum]RKE92367.1 hypothetical protein BXY80_2286 [Ichthyenterobacterium magnum]
MTILVANNHLKRVGGSETYTYALINVLIKKGYNVEYFTFFKGAVSKRIEKDLNVKFMSKSKYDLILANHNTCVNYLSRRGKIIQTCHGIFPKEEQPSAYADGYISISKEVKDHLKGLGFDSEIVVNGINCDRYKVINSINPKLKNVLSLSQSEIANDKIKIACDALGLQFSKLNKNENPIWHVENMINKADLVIGLGRSAYEAMACGRTVLVFDERPYFKSFADGYMTPELVYKCVEKNCSGRYSQLELSTQDLMLELKKYKKEDGDLLRELALKEFNIDLQTDKILSYASSVTKKRGAVKLVFASWYQNYRMNKRKRKKKKKDKRK